GRIEGPELNFALETMGGGRLNSRAVLEDSGRQMHGVTRVESENKGKRVEFQYEWVAQRMDH
ncbi:MAG: hypothetical protein L0228_19240, partial [Planctomycetes bacterium]|nr:hypothetical protein [Planctomycetota bacterium]